MKSILQIILIIPMAIAFFYGFREFSHMSDGNMAVVCAFLGFAAFFSLYIGFTRWQLGLKLNIKAITILLLICIVNEFILGTAATLYFHYAIILLPLTDYLYFTYIASRLNKKTISFSLVIIRLVLVGGVFEYVIHNRLFASGVVDTMGYRDWPMLNSLWVFTSIIMQHLVFNLGKPIFTSVR
jgi:hypothetical protein